MKKLLLVLMLVSMTALLFTGCLPATNTAPVITTTSLPNGVIGTAYTATVTATDADLDALTYTVTGITDMAISSAGVLSGWTPSAAGTFNATVTVTDGTDPVTSTFPITITAVPVPAQGITIGVATEWTDTATGRTYVKAGDNLITVTFKNAAGTPAVKVGTVEVSMFTVDSKVYTGTGSFVGPCDDVTIYVNEGVCEDEDLCDTKPVVVDSGNPYAELQASVSNSLCACETGYALTIKSNWTATLPCPPDDEGCCGDDCSGLEKWNIAVYDEDPFKDCCADDPCVDPIKEASGTDCPVTITTECIDEVWTTDMEWVDFFDSDYFVIASLTDNVGNTISYYGRVEAASTTDVKFVELHHDPTTLVCLCNAEDPALANAIIGDCDGTPTTGCYSAPIPALTCPVVTPLVATVGVGTTITLDFNRKVDEAVDGKIMAYISDGAKSTPPNIPDNALPLFLEQDATNLDIFTGEVTFDTAGSKVLYVLWDCDSCAPCMYEINVGGIDLCPKISWRVPSQEYYTHIGEVIWFKGGETYTVELTFDHVISADQQKLYQVRIRDYPLPVGSAFAEFDDFRILADMTTTDNMLFTGTFTPPGISYNNDTPSGEYCTEAYVEVDILGDCCEPCMFKFGVDATLPRAEIEITAVDNCGLAFLEFDSVEITCDATCCGDTCTSLTSWSIDIFDTIPIWDCCVLETDPMDYCQFAGSDCPIEVNQDVPCENCCLDTGDYWIITTLTDAVGNVNNYYVELTLGGNLGAWTIVSADYLWNCDPLTDGDDSNPWVTDSHGTALGSPDGIYGETCSAPF